MGNGIATGRKKAKVMKIDGQTFKLKTPIQAGDVVKDYPQGYVLLDSEAVKHFGVRAKPLEPRQELKPKKTYFLVELPKLPPEHNHSDNNIPIRRARSGVQMSAKDRLELLMLSRRTVSDVSLVRPPSSSGFDRAEDGRQQSRSMSVKVKLTKNQMAKMMEESRDEKEVVEKIMKLCAEDHQPNESHGHGNVASGNSLLFAHQTHRVLPPSRSGRGSNSVREKHVRFTPVEQGEIQQVAAL